MAIPYTLNPSEYWISSGAINITLNVEDNPQKLKVEIASGSYIVAYRSGIIDLDESLNFQSWNLEGSDTELQSTAEVYIYAQLKTAGNTATIIFSFDTLELTETSGFFNVFLGSISSSLNEEGESIPRTWITNINNGTLNIDQFKLSPSEYWMSQDALTIELNALDNPQYLQVSLLAGSVITAYRQDVIPFDTSLNYRKWNLQAYNNFFDRTDRAYVYAQLDKEGNNALIIYSYNLLPITETIVSETEESKDVYNVYLGTISSSVNANGESIYRTWETAFNTGRLNTDQYKQEDQVGEWSKMFRLNRVTDMIEVLKDMTSAVIHKLYIGARRIFINDVQTSSDTQMEASDSIVPTTKFLKENTETKFHRKDKTDKNPFLQKFLGGIEVGEFIDSMIAGKGTGIFPNGRIQTDRLEVRGSMSVMELIINEISAMMGDFSFSDCGHIEKVEPVSDGTYKLWMRKETELDFTSLDENDILYSIVNNLKTGGTDYYTSWMRVLTKNVNDNTLTIVLYPDTEVPGGKNYPPVAGYNLTRRGNAILPEEGQINERSQSWLLSSREGRIMFLANVYKPILEDYNYAISIGKFPKIEAIANLPISDTDVGIMAKTIVCEQLYQYDYNGDIIPNKVDRGEWSLAVAQSDQPYRFIQHDRLYPDGQHTYTELEQHTVYHYGCKWGCIIDKTQDEPVWNSPSWVLLEGDKNYHLEFESSNGWQFFINQVSTDIKAVVSYGNRDITNTLMATTGVEVEWLRDTGNVPSDNSWKPTYVNGQKHIIHLSIADMGSGWGSEYRKISFICRIFIPVGEDFKTIENSINIKI